MQRLLIRIVFENYSKGKMLLVVEETHELAHLDLGLMFFFTRKIVLCEERLHLLERK